MGQETTRRTDKICLDALGHFAALVMLLRSGKWQNLFGKAVDAIDRSGQKRQWCTLCHCHSPTAWKFKARINPLAGGLIVAVDSHKWLTFPSKFVPLIRLMDSGRNCLESCIYQSCANQASAERGIVMVTELWGFFTRAEVLIKLITPPSVADVQQELAFKCKNIIF